MSIYGNFIERPTELNHKLWRVLPSTIKMMVCCSGPHFFSLTIISFYRIVITHKSIVPTNREKKNGRWEIMRQWLVILHKAWAKNSLEQFRKCAFNWKLCKKLAISFFLSLSRRVHRRILYFVFNFLLFRNLIKHSMLRCEQSEKKLTHRQWKTLTVLFKLDWAHLLLSHPCASDGCFNVASTLLMVLVLRVTVVPKAQQSKAQRRAVIWSIYDLIASNR